MSNIVEILVKALVDSPDQVDVRVAEDSEAINYEVKVADDDLGKVIGRDGKTADALRIIANAAALKDKKRAFVQIVS